VARENVQRLVERDEVDVVVGIISSAVAYAVAPYLEESGVPVILTATAADGLTKEESAPNFFRVSTSSSQIMMPLGTYACEDLGYETASMVSLDYAFGYEAMGGFARAFEDAGCEIVQEIYSPLGTADWGPVVQQIDQEVDVVVQTTSGSDAVKFLQAYRDFGLTDIPLLANGFGTDTSTLPEPAQRELATDLRSVAWYAESSDSEANQAFQASFSEEFGYTPGLYAEATYVAGMVLDAALETLGDEPSAEDLTAAIADVSLEDAPRGAVSFDEYGQAVLPIYLREMADQGGELKNTVLETIDEEATQFWTYEPEEYLKFEPYTELKGSWAR
jgi:branched-chain amino acid transport system substrate-binding protein